MKTLSLLQPWASAIALGLKRVETRSWPTAYRGPIAIHASKGFPGWARDFACEDPAVAPLFRAAGLVAIGEDWTLRFPLGKVVATARLTACIDTEDPRWRRAALGDPARPHEEAFGDYGPGRYMWFLSDVVALPEPIPARGALGLWEWEPPLGVDL